MSLDDENQDTQFMLKRCLSLCLTDRKGAIADGQSIGFDLVQENEAYSPTLYAPLALLCHALRLIDTFSRDILPFLSGLLLRNYSGCHSKSEPKTQSAIHDSKATLRAALRSYELRRIPDCDFMTCALVGEEFVTHCETLDYFFQNKRTAIKNPSLIALLDWFHSKVIQMRSTWDLLSAKSSIPITRIKSLLSLKQRQFLESLCDSEAGGTSVNSEASNEIEAILQKCGRGARFAKRLIAWRERWRMTSSGFGPGSKLNFQQTRNAPALFEIWCFMELANAFRSAGKDSMVQCSLLRGSTDAPSFRGSNAVEIYYDFHGTPQLLPLEQRVLNRIHVEWFLRNRKDYAKSVVIDTKYKASESVNHLTTLGYMSAFQVNRGVAIFRRDLDLKAFRTSEGDSRFALCKFGREQILSALLMVPRRDEIRRNATTMEKLIEKVILS